MTLDEVAQERFERAEAERDQYRGLLEEWLTPRPQGVSLVEWLEDWTGRVREVLGDV